MLCEAHAVRNGIWRMWWEGSLLPAPLSCLDSGWPAPGQPPFHRPLLTPCPHPNTEVTGLPLADKEPQSQSQEE